MKFLHYILLPLIAISSLPICGKTILTPKAAEDYARRMSAQPQLAAKLSIPEDATPEEKDALTFLYAYIPTSDAADYSQDFFLQNVRLALQASREMPWGSIIPDREWRHFVLPVRVNNENLDMSREVFFNELKPRVEGMSMKDAILEVNHWCHEKVSYQPTDQRTSSPLATVKNASGRCGEESTFTVAALRSIGIPARQVYTPRWAHTDDNHAWVEAWADGKWYFLGACEPEPELNMAWFNDPASRGMLMTTKVIGAYDGKEEKLEVSPISTVINVTENYAPTAVTTVRIIDENNQPIENAKVRFCLYNYAEFYPLTEKTTDKRGITDFISGKGDMVVWASNGKRFNIAPVAAGDTLDLCLDKSHNFEGALEFNLTPPKSTGGVPKVGEAAVKFNERRKMREDSVRSAYVNSFLTLQQAEEICQELGIEDSCASILVKSRGNHSVIEKFLRDTPADSRQNAVSLLEVLTEKDLHDVTLEVLEDNLYLPFRLAPYGTFDADSELFKLYVINPRIEFEELRPYREAIHNSLTRDQLYAYSESPEQIAEDLNKLIATDDYNPESLTQSPLSTLEWKLADARNKGLAFVAVCRSIGVPARIDPISHNVQYADTSGNWINVNLDDSQNNISADKAASTIIIENHSSLGNREPKYYSQFTISRVIDGFPELLEFDDFESVESINRRDQPLACGQYSLLSGQRLADGTVLSRIVFFQIEPDEKSVVSLIVRQDESALQVIGDLDAEMLYTPVEFTENGLEASDPCSILSTTGRGYYALGIVAPGHEPSAHALNDIAEASEEISATGRPILILFPDLEATSRFRPEDYGPLPACVKFGIDNGRISDALRDGLELKQSVATDLPIFVIADSFNRIIYLRQGYSIGLGDSLAKILNSIKLYAEKQPDAT